MKYILPIFLSIFILISCKKEDDAKTKQIKNSIQVDTSKIVVIKNIGLTKEDTLKQKERVNHLFVANGGSILYLKNGEIKGQARFDTDGDFVLELLKTETCDDTYKDYDNYLITKSGDTTTFFYENGRIENDWKILKGVSVNHNLQVSSFTTSKQKNSNEIDVVDETKLIIFSPETKIFKDENSTEAENYFTAMDDLNYYSAELKNYFAKIKIETFYTKKRYLSFEIENGETIIVDTKNKINNYKAQCLLYKKRKRPIIVYWVTSDEDKDEMNNYLKN